MNNSFGLSRRAVARGIAGTIGIAALAPIAAAQQQNAAIGTPPSVITNPPRQWGPHAHPNIYPDPDIIVIDPSFRQYLLGITAIHRVGTGYL
jgi:gluconolactonase